MNPPGFHAASVAFTVIHAGNAADESEEASPVFPVVGMPYYMEPFTSKIVGCSSKQTDKY